MAAPQFPFFHSGDFVEERGSNIRGHIVGPGKYPGEWRIQRPDGGETTCLAENLTALREQVADRHDEPNRIRPPDRA